MRGTAHLDPGVRHTTSPGASGTSVATGLSPRAKGCVVHAASPKQTGELLGHQQNRRLVVLDGI